MSYVCSSLLACPTCGIGCNYSCTSSTPSVGTCTCNETVPGNGACDGRENVPAVLQADDVRKTRGVPGVGSGTRGPRGQRQEFSNFVPAPNCWSGCPNPTAIYQPVGQGVNLQTGQPIGLQCPPSHPNTQAPNCAPPPPQQAPGITTTFVNNMQSGFNRFGCSFLYNRHQALHNKLMQLQSDGTNPLWQQMLGNRINYINSVIMNNCTGGPTPGPTGGTPPPPGYGSNNPNNPNNPTNPALNYATNMGISQAPQVHTMGY